MQAQTGARNLITDVDGLSVGNASDDAIKTINEAIRAAKTDGDLQTSRGLQKRLLLYKQDKPFRDAL